MTNLIPHTINASVINQRSSDGYIHATAMCRAADKLLADYRRLSSTNEYLCALSNDMGNPITDLIQIKRGGRPAEQGTWVHPKVANKECTRIWVKFKSHIKPISETCNAGKCVSRVEALKWS